MDGVASRQKALLRRDQLIALGLSSSVVDGHVRAGRLTVMHRGVYLVGPVVPPGARELAAVYACGPGAVASHRSAAFLHGLLPAPDDVEVTVVNRWPESRRGLIVHRTRELRSDETLILDDVPVTTRARAILDLAPTLSTDTLEQLMAEACATSPTTRKQLDALLARYPRRRGSRKVRHLLTQPHGPAVTRSPPERLLLKLLREADLPEPETNAPLLGYEVDILWRELKLVAEFDGHAFHSARPKRERDSRRDQDLVRHGYAVLRITWAQLTRRPTALVARIAMTIGRRAVELAR